MIHIMRDDYLAACGIYVEQEPCSIFKATCGNCKRTQTYKQRKKDKQPAALKRGDTVKVTFTGKVVNTCADDGVRIRVMHEGVDRTWWAVVPTKTAKYVD